MPLAMPARKAAPSTDIVRKYRDAFVGPPLHPRFASNNGEIVRTAIRIVHPSHKDAVAALRAFLEFAPRMEYIWTGRSNPHQRLARVPGCI